MSLTDEEFRQRLEKHFSLYRINLRSPIASEVAVNHWHRIDLLLVNELGLFRRSDIEPNGQVIVTCELYSPSRPGITPFSQPDPDYTIEIRSSRAFTEGRLTDTLTIPGFENSGKGVVEYRIRPLRPHAPPKSFYLQIKPTQVVRFHQQLDFILPLVVGPIEVVPGPVSHDTSLPLELWSDNCLVKMAYEGYRVFSSIPPLNIAIHEMWDSGIPGKIWDSALIMLDVMKNMIAHYPEYLDEKHVLDLSAGTGLLGLYVGSMMASSNTAIKKGKVTITELNEAVDLINRNIVINQYLTKQIDLTTKPLLWGNSEEAAECGKVDLLVASDVLYEANFFEDLVKTFVDLSKPTTRIYIGYKRRGFNEEEERRFWSLCGTHFEITLLKFEGDQDKDDVLVPKMTLETGVQLYRLIPLV